MRPEQVLPVSSIMRGIGRPIAYYPSISIFLGSVSAGLFLSYFLYWEGKQEDPHGWIYKRSSEISKETGLGRYEIEDARKLLKKLNILEEKREGQPAKLFYRFNWQEVDALISQIILPEPVKTPEPVKEEPQQPEEKKENVLGLMKDEFDTEYNKHYEVSFNWGTAKKGDKIRGKEFNNLRRIKEVLEKRIIERKNKDKPLAENEFHVAATDEIILSFRMFLQSLPKYHREKSFSPALLYSHFNNILRDILNERNKSNSKEAGLRKHAEDFAD